MKLLTVNIFILILSLVIFTSRAEPLLEDFHGLAGRSNSIIGEFNSLANRTDSIFKEFTSLASKAESMFDELTKFSDKIRLDIESKINETMSKFKEMEKLSQSAEEDQEKTYYRMKVMKEKDGHVYVKTIKKDPGHEMEVHEEEYDRDDKKSIDSKLNEDMKKNIEELKS